ncbi:MAG: hypothetical protein JJ896_12575 [Rhodothermales bacterium]|nr:hypothetical protein [Rhodothermales bacterium]MBO6780481.1 hypothetical protein [Rhodothermales bacterium]
MRILGTHISPQAAPDQPKPRNPEEAARQFEEVLVREFVREMTKDLFGGSLAGEQGAGWVKAQGEAQGDALTDVLTRHLVESGTMGIADMLLEKWEATGMSIDRIPGLEGLPVSGPGDTGLAIQKMLALKPGAGQSLDEFLSLRKRTLKFTDNRPGQ